MTRAAVLTLSTFEAPLAAALDARGVDATVLTTPSATAPDMPDLLAQADVLVSAMYLGDWTSMGDGLPRLRLIQVPGAGYDGIDLSAIPAGAVVCNVFGHEWGIAEHVFMVMAAMDRGLIAADRALREGDWGVREPVRELRGRTLLVAGLGRIGRELLRWGSFYGMRLTAVTRSYRSIDARTLGLDALAGLEALAGLARSADVLVVALPAAEGTIGLVDARVLDAMPPTGYVINVGRGPVVDEQALYDALREGRVAGAAIDVWYRYPERDERMSPSRLPFHELSNVIMTPHQSGFTDGTMRHRWSVIADNIERVMTGLEPAHRVWPRA
jgi:phosphoglycerate dehydrogenase-like enzyme